MVTLEPLDYSLDQFIFEDLILLEDFMRLRFVRRYKNQMSILIW